MVSLGGHCAPFHGGPEVTESKSRSHQASYRPLGLAHLFLLIVLMKASHRAGPDWRVRGIETVAGGEEGPAGRGSVGVGVGHFVDGLLQSRKHFWSKARVKI